MRAHLASLVEEFRRNGAETAVVEHRGVRRYATTYGELAELAGRFAAELEGRGVGPGERVVLWGADSAEWIGVFFGCLLRGAMAVPLDAAGDAGFAARVIADVKPRLVVGDGGLLAALASSQLSVVSSQEERPGAEAPALKDRSRRLKPAATPKYGSDGRPETKASGYLEAADVPAMELRGILAALPAEPLWAVSEAVGPDTPFQIVFTSGTTSEPRGIVHTHRNVLVTLEPIEREIGKYRRWERVFHPLRFLHSLPLSHVFGQFMGLWVPALIAAEVHFAEQLEPARLVELIRRERISVLVAVPRVLQLLRANLLARFEVPGSRFEGQTRGGGVWAVVRKWWRWRRVHRALGWKFWAVISGGATLPPELEAFWNGLGFALIQGYGMTETTALVTLNHPFHIAPGTIGKTLPGREVRIGEDGEILVRGEMLAPATWQGGAMQRREGEWLATGDLAEKSGAGELKFLGRKGDAIVTGAGMNIHPADLEAALAQQAGVRGCAVVGCEFAGGPEAVAVLLFSGTEAELQAAVAAANRGLAEYQQIRHVLRWPELQLPYTPTGKLIRRRVAEWACGASSQVSGVSSQEKPGDGLLAVIAEVTGEPVPASPRGAERPADSLRLSEDLHLDSLGRVQLQSALEQRFDLELEDDAVATVQTVGELREIMEGQLSAASSPLSAGRVKAVERQAQNGKQTAGADAKGSPPFDGEAAKGWAAQADTRPSAASEEHVYPRWPWWWWVRAVRVVWIEAVMRPLVWLLARPRVSGSASRQVSGPGPVVIICNHVTAFDGALVLYALPGRVRRRVAAAMSGEMLLDFRRRRGQGNWALDLLAPGAYWLLTALFNVFPLPRARGFRRSFAHAGEAMDRGYSVLIFPEGSRSRDGKMHAFRPGIGLLARETEAPVVPVALAGLYELVQGGGRWFHAGRIEVRVGAAIPAAGETSDPAQVTAQLEQAMRDLLRAPANGG